MCVCVGLQDDMRHFHGTYKAVCDRHDPAFYPRFKKWADEYFTITFAPPPPPDTHRHHRILPRWRITEAKVAADEGCSGEGGEGGGGSSRAAGAAAAVARPLPRRRGP